VNCISRKYWQFHLVSTIRDPFVLETTPSHLARIIYKVATEGVFCLLQFDCFDIDDFTDDLHLGRIILQLINF
jgi:hypothetical protein